MREGGDKSTSCASYEWEEERRKPVFGPCVVDISVNLSPRGIVFFNNLFSTNNVLNQVVNINHTNIIQ